MKAGNNYISIPQSFDDSEVAHLFREHDSIGADSSVLLRMLRRLLKDGKPIGNLTAIFLSESEKLVFPIGVLTETLHERVVFWPLLPEQSRSQEQATRDNLDHVTLEFPSEKSHWTAYSANDKGRHGALGRLLTTSGLKAKFWFHLAVQMETLVSQDLAIQRNIPCPAPDKERRVKEFTDAISQMRRVFLPLAQSNNKYASLCCQFFVADEELENESINECIKAFDIRQNDFLPEWTAGSIANWTCSPAMKLNNKYVYVAIAALTCSLRVPLAFGFPKMRISGK